MLPIFPGFPISANAARRVDGARAARRLGHPDETLLRRQEARYHRQGRLPLHLEGGRISEWNGMEPDLADSSTISWMLRYQA